jgi:DNA-binding beta-propeller fold protein YncE
LGEAGGKGGKGVADVAHRGGGAQDVRDHWQEGAASGSLTVTRRCRHASRPHYDSLMTPGLCIRSGVGFALLLLASGCRASPAEPLVDATGETHRTVSVGQRPFGLAISATQAFVTQLDGASVTRVSLADAVVAGAALPVGGIPTGAAISPDGSLLLVSNQSDWTVSLLSTSGSGTITRFTTAASPLRVLFSPDGSRGYATTGAGDLVVIDIASRQLFASLSTGLGPVNGIAFSPDGLSLYLSSTSGDIVRVDPRTNTVVTRFLLAGQLQEVVPASEGDALYVADEVGGIAVLSLVTGTVTRLPVQNAFGLALSPDHSKIWATQPFRATLTILERTTGTPVRIVSLQGASTSIPRRVAFDQRRGAVVTDEAGFVHVFP